MKSAALGLILLTLLDGGSYIHLSGAEEVRFYKTRGRGFVGRRLHIHLSPAPFLKPPKLVRLRCKRPVYHQYLHRGVKFLVHPQNAYYLQFKRKRKAGKIVCVKGRVLLFPGKIGPAVLIHRIRGITKQPKKRPVNMNEKMG